jgi:hypothetical protein
MIYCVLARRDDAGAAIYGVLILRGSGSTVARTTAPPKITQQCLEGLQLGRPQTVPPQSAIGLKPTKSYARQRGLNEFVLGGVRPLIAQNRTLCAWGGANCRGAYFPATVDGFSQPLAESGILASKVVFNRAFVSNVCLPHNAVPDFPRGRCS